jgi:hypothetical protein
MLCPSCNKFAAFSTDNEPEVEVEVDEVSLGTLDDNGEPGKEDPDTATARVSGTCRIVLTSECCGDDMKESNFDISDVDIEVTRAEGCTCDLTELEAEYDSAEITDRNESEKVTIAKRGPNKGKEVRKTIPYRYQKRFYGASVDITVKCGCGKTSGEATWTDEIQASGMDELV